MTPEDIAATNKRQRWLVIATLFLIMFFVLGGTFSPLPLFLTPLIKQYGWSHARVSWVPTLYLLMFGLIAPVAGWLMDRLEARVVTFSGALLTVIGMVGTSRTHSFWPMLGAFVLIGAGVAGTTIVPCSVVAANWFADNRGLAIGATIAGAAVGGVVMPVFAEYMIGRFGLSTTFIALAVPILVLALPLLVLVIRTRPAGATKTSVAEEVKALPGLELDLALRTLPFWLLAFILMIVSVGLNGTFVHVAAFLIGVGYSPQHAAVVLSVGAAVTVPGYLLMGVLADRFTGRRVLPWVLVVLATGVLLLLGARRPNTSLVFLVAYLIAFGLTGGVTTSLVPVVMVETLGLRRFGSISGLIGLAATLGIAGGPLAVGWIFDFTGSYTPAFELNAACIFLGAMAALLVSPADGVETIPAPAVSTSH
jgi:MFS family permease